MKVPVVEMRIRLKRPLLSLACVSLALAQSEPGVFVANTDLQSIAVRVTDKQGHDVHGLAASDFTILEDGIPQKTAFFGSENQPISLAVLLDTSFSMNASQKLDRARKLLGPLLRSNLPGDEIFFTPFTDQVGPFRALTKAEQTQPPLRTAPTERAGTALYDALASTLCNMRTARNVRQALIVITDGADQHSRLALDQLIRLAESSKPQIFMIGFFDPAEYDQYKESGKTVTLVNGREIDNPLTTFDRMSKESGAEAFFPSSERDLSGVLDHILGVLHAEYSLAYYPEDVQKLRLIRVKVNRGGVTVASRRAAGSVGPEGGPVHLAATSCTVSPADHPFPWESHFKKGLPHTAIYQEDFSDSHSGWPNHPGSRYLAGAYEILSTPEVRSEAFMTGARGRPTVIQTVAGGAPGTIAAYGPEFDNFRASFSFSGKWSASRTPEYTGGSGGMVFRLNGAGCYLAMLSATGNVSHIGFKLVRRTWDQVETPIIPWTEIPQALRSHNSSTTLTVECSGERITVFVDGQQVGQARDGSFSGGQVGMAVFGQGRGVFRALTVEERP